jgi:hypothetical protein
MPRSFKPIVAAAVLLASITGVAVAQTPHNWPIVDGRQLQPTQGQLESTHDAQWNRWNDRVAPQLDHLNDEIMHATTQP